MSTAAWVFSIASYVSAASGLGVLVGSIRAWPESAYTSTTWRILLGAYVASAVVMASTMVLSS